MISRKIKLMSILLIISILFSMTTAFADKGDTISNEVDKKISNYIIIISLMEVLY